MLPKLPMKCHGAIDIQGISDAFGIISQANRLQIICLLNRQGELCVCKIIEALGLKANLASHHLNLLKNIGLLKARREGKNIHYSIDQDYYNKFKENIKHIFNI